MKQQSALEMLVVYSWAVLLIGLFVALALVISGSTAPSSYLPGTCSIQPLLPCAETLLTSYSASNPITFTVEFVNQLGVTMEFPADALNVNLTNIGSAGSNNYYGTCNPSTASSGSQVICTATIPGSAQPSIGSQTSASFSISYYLCAPGTACNGPYISTGTSTQPMVASKVKLSYISILASPTTGRVVINGVNYYSGTNAILLSGKYTVYGSPPPGYTFSSWAASGNVLLGSQTSQSTIATVSGNGTLSVDFTNLLSTTTISTISTTVSTISTTISTISTTLSTTISTTLSTTVSTTTTIACTAGPNSYTSPGSTSVAVPAYCYHATVTVEGGGGGGGGRGTDDAYAGGSGGAGGYVSGTFAVNPGSTLYIWVGGGGTGGYTSGGTVSPGGTNGGGSGGGAGSSDDGGGGGGGGYSGVSTSPSISSGTVMVASGGGGGAGTGDGGANGGTGGGTGASGTTGTGAGAGGGGTTSSGGAGGGSGGTSGGSFVGGNGGTASAYSGGGGGGGGGYYGGGGGGYVSGSVSGAGGGGGSNFVAGSVYSVTNNGNGSPGGAGSATQGHGGAAGSSGNVYISWSS